MSDLITNYDLIAHLEDKLDEPHEFEWRFHIKEEKQSLCSYTENITPNNKSEVLLRLDMNCSIELDYLITWLNKLYNINIIVSSPVDVNRAALDLFHAVRKSSWKGFFVSPLIYTFIEYIRKRKLFGHVQYRGDVIMSQIGIELKDATSSNKCLIFTNKDLYDSGTAFVFGLSEMNGDISLISNYYFSANDPKSKIRLLKIVIHEFGHTLGIEHCTNHKCIFGGIGSIEELDSHPLLPCLEDCSKIAFACNRTLKQQLEVIIALCQELNVIDEVKEEYNRILTATNLLHH